MSYEPGEYEQYRQRMVEYHLQMNALDAQKATIAMGELAKRQLQQSPQNPIDVIIPTSASVQTVEVRDYAEEIRLQSKLDDEKNRNYSQKEKIKFLESLIKEDSDFISQLSSKLTESHETNEFYAELLNRKDVEIQQLTSELNRLRAINPMVVPSSIQMAQRPVLRAPMQSQGHFGTSMLARWALQQSIDKNKYSMTKVMHIPTDYEREKIAFMEQHDLYRMNEFEIPSEEQHHVNLGIWEKM